jgi:hypothetical protein
MQHRSPSERIVAAAIDQRSVTDAAGRTLQLRRMDALDRLRLFKAAGPTLAQNEYWLGMASLACSVTAIDEVPVPAPVNEQQIESLVSRLGDAGISAVAKALHADPAATGLSEARTQAGN